MAAMFSRVLGQARFRLGSARRARELHAQIEGYKKRAEHSERLLERERSVERTVNRFHELYYDNPKQTWQNTYWCGVRVLKCPLDLWVYQELISEIRPDYIIETGTAFGGSALYMAHVCDQFDRGRILTVDLEERPGHTPPEHERIEYITGSSTDAEVVNRIRERLDGTVMVILDSDHSYSHVIEEMRIYGEMVTPGSYMIAEDSNVNGNPVYPNFGAGPMEAIEKFTTETEEFEVDKSRQKFFMTFNPRGYLQKKAR